jgi:CRISPR/Cas system CMR-associated protein Cmr1 (group 7 of RAMP superfamily)
MKYDINKIMQEYDEDFDFDFATESEEDFKAVIAEKDETVEEYKQRLEQVEKIIMPFLTKLLKTADQPIIKWPNRGPVIEKQIQKILSLTRE